MAQSGVRYSCEIRLCALTTKKDGITKMKANIAVNGITRTPMVESTIGITSFHRFVYASGRVSNWAEHSGHESACLRSCMS